MLKRLTNWQMSLIATILMGIVMLGSGFLFSAASPPEMLFNFTSQLLGVPAVFNFIHSIPWGLDRYAKYVLYGTTIIIYLALWFGLGLSYRTLKARIGRFLPVLAFTVLSVFVMAFVLFPLQRLGVFGLSSNNFLYPVVSSHLWTALFGFVFAAALFALNLKPKTNDVSSTDKEVADFDPSRREALRLMVGGAATLSLLSIVGRAAFGTIVFAQEAVSELISKIKGIAPEVTSTEDHYQVSKNVRNPDVPANKWSLKIKGMVNTELEFNLEELKALPQVERISTLSCISNRVGGDLIGNSLWTGVMLKDVLELAGIQDGANEIILRAADNYSDSFVLDAGLREGTIIAYLQNGEPLTKDHGAPARILVPGIYGMKNVKWVTEIELDNTDHIGYWQSRGWSDLATERTMSRIDTAEATRLDNGMVAIGGIAFAGLRGISKVEVSTDSGSSWSEARVKPAINELAWNLWGFEWEAQAGNYSVLVRATDGLGEVQTEETNRPLPDGATGYHRLNVQVKA